MDDLAAELGMSKKTLYAHFRSKTALVEAAVLDKLGGLEAELEHIEAECPSDFPKRCAGCWPASSGTPWLTPKGRRPGNALPAPVS
jgi:AcrR family transcriptional regulator